MFEGPALWKITTPFSLQVISSRRLPRPWVLLRLFMAQPSFATYMVWEPDLAPVTSP